MQNIVEIALKTKRTGNNIMLQHPVALYILNLWSGTHHECPRWPARGRKLPLLQKRREQPRTEQKDQLTEAYTTTAR
jgi:hypothetical protein